MDEDLKQLLETMQRQNADAEQETRRHFDVAVERIETRFDLLAEMVQSVNQELRSTRVSLDEKIERSAAETQAMIKFSHKEFGSPRYFFGRRTARARTNRLRFADASPAHRVRFALMTSRHQP